MSLWDWLFGYDDYSDYSDYSDSSMRDEIARLKQEVRDMERKISRIQNASTEEIRESYASFRDNVDNTGALPQEIFDYFDLGDKAVPNEQKLQHAAEALSGLVNKEQERLKAIDSAIARINEIELESGDEGKQ
ncbi:hypothetical protein [Succinimonas sp.]|uniref:hypothetical protein n=1 Tax=Succinimonas sp. TaxID=1936151 RepID=UPI003864B559